MRHWHTAEEAEFREQFCETVAKCFTGDMAPRQSEDRAVARAEGAMAAAKSPRTKADMRHKSAVRVWFFKNSKVDPRVQDREDYGHS